MRTPHRDLSAFLDAIDGVPTIRDPVRVRRRSRDFFWYSPILNAQLHGKTADLVVVPRNEADVLRVAGACARHRIPLTPRGAGTGNYGQAVPLDGGIILDLTDMHAVAWQRPGAIRVEPGAKMVDIDAATRPKGWELRMHPSTKRTATIGGFVAGGSGGIGSVTYGGLREPGNILAARIVTLEAEPRVIELRADAAQKVNRAYGTTGIITMLEMPLAPAWPWVDLIVAFDDFFQALEFGQAAALADGIVKKLLTPMIWPLPSYFGELKPHCPQGKSLIFAMIAEPSLEIFKALLGDRGEITYEASNDEAPGVTPLYEYTWNHTTLHVLKADRGITYLQCLFPHDRLIASVRQMHDLFGDEVLPHLEFIRFGGRVTASALPIVRFTTARRLDEIIATFEAHGVLIANP
ncbi:MAG: FAD-binding oxidoreductase, partial [Methylobacteriaceae bacterium]|nr:FAD-binding oxidoreductase [Methylobacteriaceae bacterium]